MATEDDDKFHEHFHKKTRFLLSQWKNASNAELFQNVDAILLLVGDDDEENVYFKSKAAQIWLLGFPLYQTLILLTPEKITFVSSTKKCDKLEALRDGKHEVEIIRRGKTAQENAPLYVPLLEDLKGKRLGVLSKDDKQKGKIADEWTSAQSSTESGYESVDVSDAISACLAVKDEDEVQKMQIAAKISSNAMGHYFVEEMSTIIDEGKKVSHEELTERTERTLDDDALRKKIRIPSDMKELDWCYNPIIQSGGEYDLRPSVESNRDHLHGGVILCSLGVQYKYYCSNIGRTFLIDPTNAQEENYKFLVKLQEQVIDSMRDGVKINDVYEKAVKYIKDKRPDLAKHFTKSIGFGMGIEFREGNYVLKAKKQKQLKKNMVFNVSLGFSALENPKPADERSKIYALLLIDTVRVTGDLPIVMTDYTKKLNDISYFFKDEDDKMDVESPKPTKKKQPAQTAILRSKFRSEEQDEEESNEQKRAAHQKELLARKLADGLAKYSNPDQSKGEVDTAVFQKFESYRSETKLPHEVREQKIIVDRRSESIIVPIYGLAVPFHISTLKQASLSDEGESMRLNFITPGQPGGKKENLPFNDVNATFVRALTFRSANTARMARIYDQIDKMKKEAAKKEAAKKDMADVVEQENLRQIKGGVKRLPDVFVRPSAEGKRLPGVLEIHENGLRYQAIRSDHSFNVLFSNVKHLFFQPCDNELIVLIHVHFKNPIMMGKKKTKEIQFYREASDVQFDETGNRRRRHMYGDEDELESEREERRRRARLNAEFKSFADHISDASNGRVEVDIPFRDLAFQGVPFRTNVLLQPTTDCLVHLTDPPFLVVTLSEIEIAYLERVQFGLKNFDMVFVFKDFSRTPLHINTIPVQQLDNVKEWLNSVEVVFTEGPVNLNWGSVMKTINENPAEFFRDGGWKVLRPDSDEENSENESDSESEFEIEEEEFDESSSDDDNFESDASANSEEEEEELSDSGEDWDELEDKARKADERKLKRNGEEEEAPRKKSRR